MAHKIGEHGAVPGDHEGLYIHEAQSILRLKALYEPRTTSWRGFVPRCGQGSP